MIELSDKLATGGLLEDELERCIAEYPDSPGLLGTRFPPENQIILHVAARHNCAFIAQIIDKNEHGASLTDCHDKYPLHYAAQYHDLKTVKALLDLFKFTVERADKSGKLPLHYACMRSDAEAVDVVNFLVQSAPELVRVKSHEGCLPLHYAAAHSNCDVIHVLLSVFYGGLFEKDNHGRLPLHSAVRYEHSSAEVVDYLVRIAQGTVDKKDKNGQLPLHVALCVKRPSLRVVNCLVDAYPASFAVADRSGLFPIHHASRNKDACNVVEFLVRSYPDECKRNCNGGLALHMAVTAGQDMCVIQAIVAAYPPASAVRLGKKYPHAMFPAGYPDQRCMSFLRLVHECFVTKTKVEGDVSHGHIHVCGDGYAGKSVLSHWLVDHFSPLSLMERMSRPTTHDIPLEERTRGIQSVPVLKNSCQYYCHDYGGQAEYLVNHANHLGEANSVYIIVVPLWDPKRLQKSPSKNEVDKFVGDQFDKYKFWLKFVYSVVYSGGRRRSGAGAQQVQILTVLNTFGLHYNVDVVKTRLVADAQGIFDQSCPAINFWPILNVDVSRRECCADIFSFVEDAFKLVCATNISHGNLLTKVNLALKSHMPKILPRPKAVGKVDALVLALLSARKNEYECLLSCDNSEEALRQIIKLVREHLLQSLQQMGEIMFIPIGLNEQLVLLDPCWARSKLLGNIIHILKRDNRYTIGEQKLGRMLISWSFADKEFAGPLCESLGLCVLVGREYNFFALLGDDETVTMKVIPIAEDADRLIARTFVLADQRFIIIPGYFYPLFAYIHKLTEDKERVVCKFYNNGMQIDCVGMYDSSDRTKSCRVQYIVHSFVNNDPPRFDVVITSKGITDRDFAWQELDKIRQFIQTQSWNVKLHEHCCVNPGPDCELFSLRAVETVWFGSVDEHASEKLLQRKMNVRETLLGKSMHSTLLDVESLALLLSKTIHEEGSSIVGEYSRTDLGIEAHSDGHVVLPDSLFANVAQMLLLSQLDEAEESRFIKTVILAAIHDHIDQVSTFTCKISQKMMAVWVRAVQRRLLHLRSGGDMSGLPHVEDNLPIDNSFEDDTFQAAHVEEDSPLKGVRSCEEAHADSSNRTSRQDTRLHALPLFPIVHTVKAKTFLDWARQIVAKQYRVSFVCPVCCKEAFSEDDNGGYKLFVFGQQRLVKDLLIAFRYTIKGLEIAGKISGIPTGLISVVDDAIAEVFNDIIPPDVQQFVTDLHEVFGASFFPSDSIVTSHEIASTLSVLSCVDKLDDADSGTDSHGGREPAHIEALPIGPTYLSTIKQLFKGLNDAEADRCGLVSAKYKEDATMAWVCKGSNGNESMCCRLFHEHGEKCLRIRYKGMGLSV